MVGSGRLSSFSDHFLQTSSWKRSGADRIFPVQFRPESRRAVPEPTQISMDPVAGMIDLDDAANEQLIKTRRGKKENKLLQSSAYSTQINRSANIDWKLLNILVEDQCPNGQIKKEKFVEVYDQLYSDGKSSDFCSFTFGLFDREDSETSNNELELNFLQLTSFSLIKSNFTN
ncbi:unnamed protein product [Adineta ricciae]|uniref:Uncharacterized protein n=1 Tax=Adineta ricciae TaxID=249248 RepID=A0A815PFE6_ADIRI|nr:unnamed protein product [Adineta ricciae]